MSNVVDETINKEGAGQEVPAPQVDEQSMISKMFDYFTKAGQVAEEVNVPKAESGVEKTAVPEIEVVATPEIEVVATPETVVPQIAEVNANQLFVEKQMIALLLQPFGKEYHEFIEQKIREGADLDELKVSFPAMVNQASTPVNVQRGVIVNPNPRKAKASKY